MDEVREARAASRCRGVTRAGRPCRRSAASDGFCRQHGARFYARALSEQDRVAFEAALAQEGLDEEVALLRLHLLRLLQRDDPARPGEIPRTVHALLRALRDGRGPAEDAGAALDDMIRAEGRRALELDAAAGDRDAEE